MLGAKGGITARSGWMAAGRGDHVMEWGTGAADRLAWWQSAREWVWDDGADFRSGGVDVVMKAPLDDGLVQAFDPLKSINTMSSGPIWS